MTKEIKEKKTLQQRLDLVLVILVYFLFMALVIYLHGTYHRFGWLGFVGTIVYGEFIHSLNKKRNFL